MNNEGGIVRTRPELLLVDDDPTVIHALNRLFDGQVSVRSATSGQAAIELLEAAPADLLMLDLDMPGLSGFEVLDRLKASNQLATMPVIVLSGCDEPGVEARVLESGAADFVAKPFVPSHVLARVRAQLQLRRIQARASRVEALQLGEHHDHGVLIVDDDVHAIHALRATLMPLGLRIRFAGQVTDAMRAIESEPPDLIVLDVQLADGSGFDLCAQLREDPLLSRTPVLIVTRFDDELTEAQAYDLGAMDFVSKRCGPQVFRARVRKLLRLKHETDALFLALDRHWRQVGDSRLAMMVEASSDGILSVDEQGRICLINQAACHLLGVRREDVLQRAMHDVLPEGAGRDAMLEVVRSTAMGSVGLAGATSSFMALPGSDGAVRLVEPRCFQLNDHGTTLTTVSLRDVTEREAASQQLQEHAKAQASSQARAMMLSCVVHEIGNPLNAIMGFSQLLRNDHEHPLDPVQSERLRHLILAGEHLTHLTADLRDVGLLELGQFQMSLESFDLSAQVDDAVDAIRAGAELAGIELEWPRCGDSLLVMGDARRLHQCLLNVLGNAVKYNHAGGRVQVEVSKTATMGTVSVSDTGKGMPSEQLRQLFKPFQRLGQEQGNTPGTGLGLVISRMLIDAMGGSLTAESRAGEGSRFILAVPLSTGSG